MLESILQGLREVEGVHGAMVVDHTATIIAHRAHSIYDLPVLQQVARSVVHAVDSVQLIQDDWDVLTAHYGEGKLLLRSLRTTASVGRPRRYILALIADATLNVAFVGVALRVAAGKLVSELDDPPPAPRAASASAPLAATGSSSARRVPVPDHSWPELANSGLGWSGVNPGSGVGSDAAVADAASSTFLAACTKALAASVGPMAKVFVKEAVRKVCGDQPFSRADGPAVLAHLATTIDDPEDRAVFQRTTRTL